MAETLPGKKPRREPLGSLWQVIAALPFERVEPTPYQRDLSEPHVKARRDRAGQLLQLDTVVVEAVAEEG